MGRRKSRRGETRAQKRDRALQRESGKELPGRLAWMRVATRFLVVVDVEATCWDTEPFAAPYAQEIIELPAVLVDVRTQEVVDRFRTYVRPEEQPELSDFCQRFTGIKQADVDAAPTLEGALALLHSWLQGHALVGEDDERLVDGCSFATDGPWDFNSFLLPECRRKGLHARAYFATWVNLRWLFSWFLSAPRCGVSAMLRLCGLEFEGRPHCGLDDTVNIARIATSLISRGCLMQVNDGSGDRSVKAPPAVRIRHRHHVPKLRELEAAAAKEEGDAASGGGGGGAVG